MDPDLPIVQIPLWRADAIVLFDWLMQTDLNSVPITHKAQNRHSRTCSHASKRPT
jgi:hypothetical protein